MTIDQPQTLPSERSFGLLFGVEFVLLAAYGWFFKSWPSAFPLFLVATALAFVLFSFVAPWGYVFQADSMWNT